MDSEARFMVRSSRMVPLPMAMTNWEGKGDIGRRGARSFVRQEINGSDWELDGEW